MTLRVAVVGAGLAGLAAAADLAEGGAHVVVLEASDGVGGRMHRPRRLDGTPAAPDAPAFQLDRGFQVLLTAYPVEEPLIVLDGEATGAHLVSATVLADHLHDGDADLAGAVRHQLAGWFGGDGRGPARGGGGRG